jgi:hypothetical protein
MHSLTSALEGGEWSASRPGRFTPRERAPITYWIGSWLGPRAVLDAVVNRVGKQILGMSVIRFENLPSRPLSKTPPRPDRLWGPPSLLSNEYRSPSLGVKPPGHEADHSPPFSAQVKNV